MSCQCCKELEKRVRELEDALLPFTTFNSSEEWLSIKVKSEWVTRARQLTPPSKGITKAKTNYHRIVEE